MLFVLFFIGSVNAESTTDVLTDSLSSTAQTAAYFGVKIQVRCDTDINLISVGRSAPSSSSIVTVLNITTNESLYNASWSNNVASFSLPYPVLEACQSYYITSYSNGSTYSFKHNEPNQVYPVNGTNLNYTAGAQVNPGTGETNNGAYDIINITSDIVEPPLENATYANINVTETGFLEILEVLFSGLLKDGLLI